MPHDVNDQPMLASVAAAASAAQPMPSGGVSTSSAAQGVSEGPATIRIQLDSALLLDQLRVLAELAERAEPELAAEVFESLPVKLAQRGLQMRQHHQGQFQLTMVASLDARFFADLVQVLQAPRGGR